MDESDRFRLPENCPLLFGRRWPSRGMDRTIADLDLGALCVEYRILRGKAPRRSSVGKSYFVGHDGVTSATGRSNRLEEQCATALYNLGRSWPRLNGGWFQLLDYQVPLKARRSDVGVGKVDLLGVTDTGRLVVIELKVLNQSGGRSDPPVAALMEGVRYAAILEADIEAIASEAEDRLGRKIVRASPIVQLLAPRSWWHSWLDLRAGGDWGPSFTGLVKSMEEELALKIECMAFDDVNVTYGPDGDRARFDRLPALYEVSMEEGLSIGCAIALPKRYR